MINQTATIIADFGGFKIIEQLSGYCSDINQSKCLMPDHHLSELFPQ